MKLKNYTTLLNELIQRGFGWKEIGDLTLTSGKIVVCDPFVGFRNLDTFKIALPSKSNARVSILRISDIDWGIRIAFSKIQFKNEPIVKWKLATYQWSNYFMVDSGLASYMDESTCKHYIDFVDEFYARNPSGNIYNDLFAELFKRSVDVVGVNIAGDWVSFYLPNAPNENLFMFQSGLGDGQYKSYWGFTEADELAMLLTDYDLIK